MVQEEQRKYLDRTALSMISPWLPGTVPACFSSEMCAVAMVNIE